MIFFIKYIAIPIAAIMFTYAGFLLVTSGGNESGWSKAKEILWNVVLGLICVAGAWLIISLILTVLGRKDWTTWFGF